MANSNNSYKFLILEDSPTDTELILTELKKTQLDFEAQGCVSEDDFKGYLKEFKPDLILSDYNLPQFNGMEALEFVLDEYPGIPFIFVSGTLGEKLAVEALKKGATDYVLKHNLSELSLAVKRAMEETTEKTARRQAESEREKAFTEIQKRSRMLQCLYHISHLINSTGKGIREIMETILGMLAGTLHYDNYLNIKIKIKDLCITTPEFRETKINLKHPVHGEQDYGYIEVHYDNTVESITNQPFTKYDVELVKLVAHQIAVMLDKEQSQESLIQSIIETEERERQRISQDLHDGLQQKILAALLSFRDLQKKLDFKSDEGRERYQELLALLDDSINECRSVAYTLMPKGLEEFGLVPALETLIENFNKVKDIRFVFLNNLNEERFDVKIEINIYRIIQESMNNILKHSEASEATIQLMNYDECLLLTIEDNGKGFDVDKTSTEKSSGLSVLKNRAHLLRSALEINSHPGRGTSINLEISKNLELNVRANLQEA